MMSNEGRAGLRSPLRTMIAASVMGATVLSLSGCLGPTYGTGKSQGQTLFDDLNNVVSLGGGGSSNQATQVANNPRSDLVKPANTSILPPPQQARVVDLPESPEQRSARLQDAAYRGDDPIPAGIATAARKEGVTQAYLDRTSGGGGTLSMLSRENESTTLTPQELKGRGALVEQRLREQRQGSADRRKYLSEPPIAYRKPAATAPVGDQGVDEEVKQRRLRQDDSLASKIRNILPF